jgi:AcrR family transcriptional regulator
MNARSALAEPAPETKGARTRVRILDAAAGVFREKGYAATSLNDIAAAAGLKTGSLYFHFPTKDGLVHEMLKHGIAVTIDQVREAVELLGPDASAQQRVRAAIEAHMAGLHTQSDYAAAVLRTIDQFPPATRKRFNEDERRYHRFWQRLLTEAQRAGALTDAVDTKLLAALLLGAMNSTWRPTTRRGLPNERVIDTLIAMLGLVPPPG